MKAKQKLTPIKFLYNKNYKAHWSFKCECGQEVIRTMNTFRTNNTKSCGCHVANPNNTRIKDYTNKKFNRLLALERFRKRNKKGVSQVYYRCLCDCGETTVVFGTNLRKGNTKSCGCLDKENLIRRNKDPSFISKRNHTMNKKFIVKHWSSGEEVYCTGSWEYGTVLYLNQNKIDFIWQPWFELPNATRYICDLYLIKENKYVEIKGRWLKDAQAKVLLFQTSYPNVKFEVWDRPVLFDLKIINNQGRMIMLDSLKD